MFDRLIKSVVARFNLETAAVVTILQGILQLLTDDRVGGVNEFTARFRQAGFDGIADSWIGRGTNQLLTVPQLRMAIDKETIEEIADATGLGRGALPPILAYLIPLLVDQISPNGKLPTTAALRERTQGFRRMAPASVQVATRRSMTNGGHPVLRRLALLAPIPVLAVAAWFFLAPSASLDPILAVNNEGEEVTFTGHVKDEAARATIIDALNSTFGEMRVKGDVSVDGEVREANWIPRVGVLLSALDTPGAEFTLTGDSARVGGWLTEADRASVAQRVRGALGERVAVSEDGNRRAEAVLEANTKAVGALSGLDSVHARVEGIVHAMNFAVIGFEDGSAEIPPDAGEVIHASARALSHVPKGTKIIVAGHTDVAGDSAVDLALSESRARAVVEALESEGLDPAMLVAVGYGGTSPVDTSGTEQSRFRNERIEYAVAP